jgi:hypothetical protein
VLDHPQVGSGVEDSPQRHVAADAAKTVEVGDFHGLNPVFGVAVGSEISIIVGPRILA